MQETAKPRVLRRGFRRFVAVLSQLFQKLAVLEYAEMTSPSLLARFFTHLRACPSGELDFTELPKDHTLVAPPPEVVSDGGDN